MHESRSYDAPRSTGIGMEKQDTLTEKAIRVHGAAQELVNRMHVIYARTMPPTPSVADKNAPEPPCDHAVFAIEGTQRYLDEALRLAEKVIAAL